MKKIIFFIAIITSLEMKGQINFTPYNSAYLGKTFKTSISIKDTSHYSMYIDMYSLDKLHKDNVGITYNEKDHISFLKTLSEAKVKYNEWVKTAQANKVTILEEKEMTYKFNPMGYFLFGSDYHFDATTTLKFDFKIVNSNGVVDYLLLIRSNELQSSKNQFMNIDGVAFVFNSNEEIQRFIDDLSAEKIKEFIIQKQSSANLFKD
ncbi:MAG: hypothetical protein M3Q58_02785 [Bacteroidota bacterium]|nr:hypothetical protein [Bacteroidota bacterium]